MTGLALFYWRYSNEKEEYCINNVVCGTACPGIIGFCCGSRGRKIETAVKLIESIEEEYSIDTDRIYTTGQSMGCMTSLYLNSKYPDLFAASLYVSGQWDISVLENMKEQTFFYITSAGDTKASGGQSEVMEMFDADGTAYTYGEWNCKDTDQNEKAQELIAEGLSANMIRFEAEFTDDSGNQQSLTHMLSFNYAYKIEAVRDWLFGQTK